jgi:hypothetical protein
VVFEIPHNVAQDRGQLVSIDMYETGGGDAEGKLFGTATCPVAKIMRQGDGQAAARSTLKQPAAGGGKGTPTSSVNGPYPLLSPPDALLVPTRHGRPVSALQLIAQGAAARRPSGVGVRLLFHFIRAAPRRAGPRGFQRGSVAVFSDRDMGLPGWARPEAAPRFALRVARGARALPRPHSAAPGGPRQRWGVPATSRVGAPHFPANPAVAAVHAARVTAAPRRAPPRPAAPRRAPPRPAAPRPAPLPPRAPRGPAAAGVARAESRAARRPPAPARQRGGAQSALAGLVPRRARAMRTPGRRAQVPRSGLARDGWLFHGALPPP